MSINPGLADIYHRLISQGPQIADQLDQIENDWVRLAGVALLVVSSMFATGIAAFAPLWVQQQERKAKKAQQDVDKIYSLMQSNRARRKYWESEAQAAIDGLENALAIAQYVEPEIRDVRGVAEMMSHVRGAYEILTKTRKDVRDMASDSDFTKSVGGK